MQLVQLWHAQPTLPARHRAPRVAMHLPGSQVDPAPRSPTPTDMAAIVSSLCELRPDSRRQDAVRKLVEGWAGEAGVVAGWIERRRLVDGFSAALAAEGAAVQTAAYAAYERGEDTTSAASRLWAIVDMSVQLPFYLRELKAVEERRLIFSETERAARHSGGLH